MLKLQAYKEILSSRVFVFYSLLIMLSMASMVAFVSTAPSVFLNKYGLTEQDFTHWFSLNAVSIITINLLTSRLLNYLKADTIIKIGMVIIIASGILLFSLQHVEHVAAFMLPVIIGSIGFSLLMGTCTGKALAPFKGKAGAASALFGFIQMSVSAIAVTLVQALQFSATEQLVMFAICFVPLLVIKLAHKSQVLIGIRKLITLPLRYTHFSEAVMKDPAASSGVSFYVTVTPAKAGV